MSKNIYFTLCSNNYLAFALTLGRCLRKYDPEIKFIVGLVDQFSSKIEYSTWREFDFLPCFDLGHPEFERMLCQYNIIEFNTAVKPFYFEYLFAKYSDVDQIYYLDPDLYFYKSPKVLDMEWGEAEILLTPNLINTSFKPSIGELASLRHGMYNLGFLGLKRGAESFSFIQWWKERLKEHCRIDKCHGIFVDQKWMDLAPLFFDKIKSVKHPGWNMAWWNFSERKLIKIPTGYAVNQVDVPLIFFHFSGFKPEKSHLTERLISDEFREAESVVLSNLYADYRDFLLLSDYENLSKIQPGLNFRSSHNDSTVFKRLKNIVNFFFGKSKGFN